MIHYALTSLYLAMLLLLTGCTAQQPHATEPETILIQDLAQLPQDITAYTDNLVEHEEVLEIQKGFESAYFRIWQSETPIFNKDDVIWPFETYGSKTMYGHNLKPVKPEWFAKMQAISNFEDYGTLREFGVTIRFTHLRNFPTDKPLFLDPTRAGEGFPFDYVQNSGVHANEPVYLSHYSKDHDWVYVLTSYATGWVKVEDVVILPRENTEQWIKAQQLYITVEEQPLYTEEGEYLFDLRIGMLLPIIEEKADRYTVLVVKGGRSMAAQYHRAIVPKSTGVTHTLKFTADAFALLGNQMLGRKYGWGGMFEERDCSSTLRDLFAPFGVWLPRNSFQQAQVGRKTVLEGMSNSDKRAVITTQAVPFRTLLYKEGHVLLYLGVQDEHIIVLHDMWGIKTVKAHTEGREIVGKTVISTLGVGRELKDYDWRNDMLEKLVSFNVLEND